MSVDVQYQQYLLLGGALSQYRSMYEKCVEVFKKHIFFRPMLPNGTDILLSGNAVKDGASGKIKLDAQTQHLACFTGGMVDLAAKIFDRPQDSATAQKLVDGCIWGYENTRTGIMPESFNVLPCEDADNCEWDEPRWLETKKKGVDLPVGITGYGDRRYLLR